MANEDDQHGGKSQHHQPAHRAGFACNRDRAAQLFGELLDDPHPEAALGRGSRSWKTDTVVLDRDDKFLVCGFELDLDRAGPVRERVFERIANKLDNDQTNIERAIRQLAHRLDRDLELDLAGRRIDEVATDVPNRNRQIQPLALRIAEPAVDLTDNLDAPQRLAQRFANCRILGIALLHLKQRGQKLQVIGDAMLDLVQQHRALPGQSIRVVERAVEEMHQRHVHGGDQPEHAK